MWEIKSFKEALVVAMIIVLILATIAAIEWNKIGKDGYGISYGCQYVEEVATPSAP